MGKKQCRQCKQLRPLLYFTPWQPTICVSCGLANRSKAEDMIEHWGDMFICTHCGQTIDTKWMIQMKIKKVCYRCHTIARLRGACKSRGIAFNLTWQDVEIPTHCPLLGIELRLDSLYDVESTKDYSPTFDRIIPRLGYVRGNVWIISGRANRIKSDASLEELELITKNLREKVVWPDGEQFMPVLRGA